MCVVFLHLSNAKIRLWIADFVECFVVNDDDIFSLFKPSFLVSNVLAYIQGSKSISAIHVCEFSVSTVTYTPEWMDLGV